VLENNQIEPESASNIRREAEVLAFAARTAGQILKKVSGIRLQRALKMAPAQPANIQPAKGPAANKKYALAVANKLCNWKEISLGPKITTKIPENNKTMHTVMAKSR
jgi:hypothetical protein